MPRLPQGIKIYRKLRYRKGHGVHSPFAYNLITKVIEEKSPYYIFDEIEKVRGELLNNKELVAYFGRSGTTKKATIAEITAKEIQHCKYGSLLFRLVNFYQCKRILHIGASMGIISFYLVSSNSECNCVALEARPELVAVGKKISEQLHLKGVDFKTGDYNAVLNEILDDADSFDLIFVDVAFNPLLAKQIMEKIVGIAGNNAIIVIDSIKKNKEMDYLWKSLCKNPAVSVSIDLYALGIVFLRKGIYKQHYKTYFDDGKKQNLYPKRRQRFNFFSRRQKGNQNKQQA